MSMNSIGPKDVIDVWGTIMKCANYDSFIAC